MTMEDYGLNGGASGPVSSGPLNTPAVEVPAQTTQTPTVQPSTTTYTQVNTVDEFVPASEATPDYGIGDYSTPSTVTYSAPWNSSEDTTVAVPEANTATAEDSSINFGNLTPVASFENNQHSAEQANPDAFESDDVITYREEVQRQVLEDYLGDDFDVDGLQSSVSPEDGHVTLYRHNEDGSIDYYRVVEDGGTVKVINTHQADGQSMTNVYSTSAEYGQAVIGATNAAYDRECAYNSVHRTIPSDGLEEIDWATDQTDYATKMLQAGSVEEFMTWADRRMHQAEAQGIDISGENDFIRSNEDLFFEWKSSNPDIATKSSFRGSDGTMCEGYYGMDASGNYGYYADPEMTQKLDNGCWPKASDGGEFILEETKLGGQNVTVPSGSVAYPERAGQTVTYVNAGTVYVVEYDSQGYASTVTANYRDHVCEYTYSPSHNGSLNSGGYTHAAPLDASAYSNLPNASAANNNKGLDGNLLLYTRTGGQYAYADSNYYRNQNGSPFVMSRVDAYYAALENMDEFAARTMFYRKILEIL